MFCIHVTPFQNPLPNKILEAGGGVQGHAFDRPTINQVLMFRLSV